LTPRTINTDKEAPAALKKPAAKKKPPAKKPASKKPPAKKPTSKKPAAKKPAAKRKRGRPAHLRTVNSQLLAQKDDRHAREFLSSISAVPFPQRWSDLAEPRRASCRPFLEPLLKRTDLAPLEAEIIINVFELRGSKYIQVACIMCGLKVSGKLTTSLMQLANLRKYLTRGKVPEVADITRSKYRSGAYCDGYSVSDSGEIITTEQELLLWLSARPEDAAWKL
jgi:hypothetical protein